MTGTVLVVHGGAGVITRASLSLQAEAEHRAGLTRALQAGHALLVAGASSLDAVIAAVMVLEDDPLFNAGHGAVFTHEGQVELDAAVMDGATGKAGAVAGVRTIRNPIQAARAVMERSPHVLLSGEGADRFAADQQLPIVAPAYFHTEHRWRQLERARARDRIELDHDGRPPDPLLGGGFLSPGSPTNAADDKFGTVGAVALDRHGNLAAATSTGGLTNKRYGRIGDSPVIGAGTYADNSTAAVSGTGTGEYFMRGLVAHDIAARMRYQQVSLSDAVDATIRAALDELGGSGGVIAVDAQGQVKMGFNTQGMYRGVIRADGVAEVSIYR